MANLMTLPKIGIISRTITLPYRIKLKIVTRDGDTEYFVASYLYDDVETAKEKATKKFKCKVIEDKTTIPSQS